MEKTKTVLVCPLDWGLGHATRMVPVIDILLGKDTKVILAADRGPLDFLHQRFPGVDSIRFKGYVTGYPAKGSMALAMIRAYPKMLAEARKANKYLDELIDKHDVDVVISDNRYELHSSKVYSVFVTHQLNIQTPGLSSLAGPFIRRKVNSYIKRFDELWIPDFEGEPNLSGALSHIPGIPISNYHFIGPLSRFSLIKPADTKEKPDILVILSGPEPQRTILEKLIISQAIESGLSTTILQSRPGEKKVKEIKNIKLIPHLPDAELAGLIKNAGVIICRPGYSTIMDLAMLEKKAVFIPTPGQTEQEYLARRFMETALYYMEHQKDFDLKRATKKISEYSGFSLKNDYSILNTRIDTILLEQ